MHYIALSVVCSVAVSVLLKLAPRWQIDMRQVIAGGYLVASLACLWLLQPDISALTGVGTGLAWLVLVALGVLLPALFLVEAQAVVLAGVVRTDAAQRLSLLIPLIAAFTLFGETLTWLKLLGLALGLVAIAAIVTRRNTAAAARSSGGWLLLVFVGIGCIDILFKAMAQLTATPFAGVLLATFVLAFVLSTLWSGWQFLRGNARWQWRNVAAAVLLGMLNFGNIVFYIQAHRHLANDPALVFAAMNIGVIVVATLVGAGAFDERPSRLNYAGLILAIVAVIALAGAR